MKAKLSPSRKKQFKTSGNGASRDNGRALKTKRLLINGQWVEAQSGETFPTYDPATGKQLSILSGHDMPVRTAAYSPDGRRIVTASGDKTARIWDAASINSGIVIRPPATTSTQLDGE